MIGYIGVKRKERKKGEEEEIVYQTHLLFKVRSSQSMHLICLIFLSLRFPSVNHTYSLILFEINRPSMTLFNVGMFLIHVNDVGQTEKKQERTNERKRERENQTSHLFRSCFGINTIVDYCFSSITSFDNH